MVTNAMPEDPGLSREDQAEMFARSVVSGHPQGAVRRIVLYMLALVLIVSPIPQAAVVPLGLLAMTDQLA